MTFWTMLFVTVNYMLRQRGYYTFSYERYKYLHCWIKILAHSNFSLEIYKIEFFFQWFAT